MRQKTLSRLKVSQGLKIRTASVKLGRLRLPLPHSTLITVEFKEAPWRWFGCKVDDEGGQASRLSKDEPLESRKT